MLAHECEHCYSYKLEQLQKIKIRIGQGFNGMGGINLLRLINHLLILAKLRNDVINMSPARDKENI